MGKQGQNGEVTSVGAATPKVGKRDNALSFNRWEKDFLHLAIPAISEAEENEETVVIGFDLFLQVGTTTISVEDQLLASLDDAAKASWANVPAALQQLMLQGFKSNLGKSSSEFPMSGDATALPDVFVRVDQFCNFTLFSQKEDGAVDYHTAELAVKYHEYLQPKLQAHKRSIQTLGDMIEASGFFMAKITEGSWTATPRRENDDLAAALAQAKI